MAHDPHTPDAAFNPEDPHGEHKHDHGHTIVSWKILVAVLAVLLAFTALTVSAAQAEKWLASTFDLVLPDWVNVIVAMSIATVKGVLVMMYFMQLRYDNAFHTVIMLFCFLAFGLFLGFTALDLSSRAWIDPWKVEQISPGGTGVTSEPLVWQAKINVAVRRHNLMSGLRADGRPLAEDAERASTLSREAIAEWQRRLGHERYDAELRELTHIMDRSGIDAFVAEHGMDHYLERLAYFDPRAKAHHASHHGPDAAGSSAARSRPRHGLSGALSTSADHSDDHGAAAHPTPASASEPPAVIVPLTPEPQPPQ